MNTTYEHVVEEIRINETLLLRAASECYVPELHRMVQRNKEQLQHSLDWPQYVKAEDDTRKNVQGNVILHQRGFAKMFLIFEREILVGVISFNLIEPSNKTGYIGYWLDDQSKGKGLLSKALQALIHYHADSGELRRFVIKCRVANEASNQVALRNGFQLEGCLKQAEFLNGEFWDQNIYGRIIDKNL